MVEDALLAQVRKDLLVARLDSPTYEYRTLTFGREVTRADIRRALTDEAEHGHWELTSMAVYWGGARRAQIRRRIIRVERTA